MPASRLCIERRSVCSSVENANLDYQRWSGSLGLSGYDSPSCSTASTEVMPHADGQLVTTVARGPVNAYLRSARRP